MRAWTSDALAEVYLKLLDSGVEFVVIGGQAVNLWSQHYRDRQLLADREWSALEPFTSHDLDLLGGRVDAAAAAQALQVESVLFDPTSRTAPPNSGTLHVPCAGDELIVQFLHTPFGARREEVRATARQMAWRGRTLPVMHPLVCLESKIECLFALPQAGRQDLKHVRLSALCVRAYLLDSIAPASERELLSSLERIGAVAAEEFGIRLKVEHGLSLEEAIPWEQLRSKAASLSKLSSFLEKRWPRLESRIATRREAYLQRFGSS